MAIGSNATGVTERVFFEVMNSCKVCKADSSLPTAINSSAL